MHYELLYLCSAMRTAIIGGGAAGFFLAVNLKEMLHTLGKGGGGEMDVTIFERSQRVLAKVEVSGGGRCNCTNSFAGVTDLQQVYPRGHRLMKRLFNVFNHRDAYEWFESHGVPLVTQDDGCVFPKAQDSHAIINCFLQLARRYNIKISTHEAITSLSQLQGYDNIVVTTGGSPGGKGLQWLSELGHEIESPVPSLFTLSVADSALRALQGVVVNDVAVMLPGTKLRAEGPLLITHWGKSGPAILRLSSYAARLLAEKQYVAPLCVRWVQLAEHEVQAEIASQQTKNAHKQLATYCPFGLQQRLWAYLLQKALGQRATIRWAELNKKDVNRLMNVLLSDTYQTAGRAPFKDEFVTCGGISLKAVNLSTLESRHVPHLYFAGEVLDIDGITGGFNFQAAWTTAYTVATAISRQLS